MSSLARLRPEDLKHMISTLDAKTIVSGIAVVYGSSLIYRTIFPIKNDSAVPLPGGLPILGHAIALASDSGKFVQEQFKRFGDAFTMSLMGWKVTVVSAGHVKEFFAAGDEKLDFFAAIVESTAIEITLGLEGLFSFCFAVLSSKLD